MLEGVYPIVATPFRDDGSPDLADLARLVDFIVGAGVDGIVFPGVASEFETLAPDERRTLVEAVATANDGRVPFVVGVSSADAATSEALAKHAKTVGAAAVMAMLPPSLKDSPDAQLDYYRRIAAVGVPIILQNAPPPAGCGLAPERAADIVAVLHEVGRNPDGGKSAHDEQA